jgi:GTPase
MFVDEVDITVRAGKGGDGCIAFLHEKYRAMGGPAGGDGGNGGSVVIQAEEGLRTLADFRGRQILVAKPGQPGEGKNRHGKSAKNLLIKVPVGTIVRDRETGEILFDLVKPKQKEILAKGGHGGRGSSHFATSTHQSPRKAEPGTPGESRELTLELRLLADIGLIGLPNVGKSTLIGSVSTMRPKVANYPFTTLRPSVGVIRLGEYVSFTMADIPGLIAMAHEGKGLGIQFLRHIQRTSVLCHLIEIPLYEESLEDRYTVMVEAYRTIRTELYAYDEELAKKPEIVIWTKADTLPDETLAEFKDTYIERFVKETGCPEPVLVISAVRRDGLDELLWLLAKHLGLDPNKIKHDETMLEYVDGEPPEALLASELSMDNRDESDEQDDPGTCG